ncbi:hypothetical protein [Moritella dasanensis]|uniref:hypothetical protein n=1 Tax=Moritella dasanensis TaxID=428031 RepID=UPI0002FDCACA|nr:hypothetical protein [Moritella dasanensis]
MTFKSNVHLLQTEINNYKELEKNISVVDSYSTIAGRLNDISTCLKKEVKKSQLIRSLDDEPGEHLYSESEVFQELPYLLELSTLSRQAWDEFKDKSLQDSNNNLFNLQDSVKKSTKKFSAYHDLCWADWISIKQKDFVVPELILENQKKIYKDNELYNKYKSLLELFHQEKKHFIFDDKQLQSLKKVIGQLSDLQGQMKKDNLPQPVQKFFDSVNNYRFTRPTLDLLTEEVFIWLKENDMLSQFMVTPNV